MFNAVTNEFEVVFHNFKRELVEKSKTAQISRFLIWERGALDRQARSCARVIMWVAMCRKVSGRSRCKTCKLMSRVKSRQCRKSEICSLFEEKTSLHECWIVLMMHDDNRCCRQYTVQI